MEIWTGHSCNGKCIQKAGNGKCKSEQKNKGENRGKDDDGWSPIKYSTDPILHQSAPQNEEKMKAFREIWKSRDKSDSELNMDSLLTDEILERLEDPNDDRIMVDLSALLDGEMSAQVGLEDEDGPLVFENGEFHDSLQGKRYDDGLSEDDGSQTDEESPEFFGNDEADDINDDDCDDDSNDGVCDENFSGEEMDEDRFDGW